MDIHRRDVDEGSPCDIMARIKGAGANDITRATISSIVYIVDQYGSADEAEADSNSTSVTASTSAGTVASLVYDSLQLDGEWTENTDGYNFKMTLPAASFPEGNKYIGVEVWFTPTSGEAFLGFKGIFNVKATQRD